MRNSPRISPQSFGFTLVELLVVIAILAISLTLAVPAMVSIAQGQGMKRAVGEISGLAEQARAEAMATSTWVWLGLKEEMSDGQKKLTAVLICSKDGTSNTTASNLRLIRNPVRIENVKVLSSLTDWASSMPGTQPLASATFALSPTIRGQQVDFSGTVLGFSPRGEASLGNGAVPPWIEIGLRELRGETEITNKTASIRISGFSGQQNVDY